MLYPIITDSRGIHDLSGVWEFKLDDGTGFDEKWYEKPLEESITMPVPSSYNDMKEEMGIRDHYGWVFYQRTFAVPAYWQGQRLVLRFGAVTHIAKVYLNGRLICEHKGGFLPFEAEITDEVQTGSNRLTVAVDNRIDYSTLPVGSETEAGGGLFGFQGGSKKKRNQPNFDFFNYCGITRPVLLYTTPKTYISDIVLTNEVEEGRAAIHYQIQAQGAANVSVKCYDEEGRLAAEAKGVDGTLELSEVRLWQPLHAYLYQIQVTADQDTYTLPYGVRTVEVRDGKFLINGAPFYFKGYGKHEDTYPAGRGLNIPMNVKDISLMKWQGANSFRTSHYPYSEEMMRLCDREGIVVIDETPAVGLNLNFGGGANFKNGKKVGTFDPEYGLRTAEHHRDVIRDMIARDKNHACVVMWSIANEPDSFGEEPYQYFKPLFDLARELDPQKRPCTLVSVQVGGGIETDCSLRLSDVICINRYYGWYSFSEDFEGAEAAMRNEYDYIQQTGKPFMLTEYGADTVMGFHDTVPVMYTEEFQVEYYRMNHKVMDSYSHLVGEQVWNFADFATSQGLFRVQGNKKGIFTRDRRPKMVAHYLRERWTSIPDFGFKRQGDEGRRDGTEEKAK